MTDWLGTVTGPYRPAFAALMRELPLDRVRHLPRSKQGGLPLGREAVVLGRFLRGHSNALNPSGLASLYRASRSTSERLLFRGLVLGEPLGADEWMRVIPDHAVAHWRGLGLLIPAPEGRLAAPFRVIPLEGLRLLADTQDERFPNRVHIGQDSMNTLDFVRGRPLSGRLLDVGTGTGILALSLAPRATGAVAIDINPRAVGLARLNADINSVPGVTVEQCDVFDVRSRFGTFDHIVWNAPFVFFPPEQRAVNIDGDGGDMGIELTLRFVGELSNLLSVGGEAHIMSAAPVLRDGRNVLEEALRSLARECMLDINVRVVQDFWDPGLRAFHAARGIVRFESVILSVRFGAGKVCRQEAPLLRRGSDAVRGLYYERLRA